MLITIIFVILIFILNITFKYKIENYVPYNNLSINFEIDAVITWVNGYDLNWIKERNKYSSFNTNLTNTLNNNVRFNDCNELIYCLFGIYYYLPWINKIYLVTMYPQKPVYFDLLKKYIN